MGAGSKTSVALKLGVAVLSAVLIAFQLLLMQTLAVVHWHHFAHMIISVALLGFGTSGTVLALLQDKLLAHADVAIPVGMTLAGLTMGYVIPASQLPSIQFDIYLLFIEPWQNVRLVAHYLLFFLPFFFGALSLALIFSRDVAKVGALYSANLCGSAAGGAMGMLLLWLGGPGRMSAFAGLAAVVAGALVTPGTHRRWQWLHLAAAAILLIPAIHGVPLTPSPYKSISKTLNLPEATVVAVEPSPMGVVEAVESPALRFAPGLSLSFVGTIPQSVSIFVNGEGYTSVVPASAEGPHILDYATDVLPFLLTQPDNVLVLGSGAGVAVAHALSHGSKHVVAVEPHREVIDLTREKYGTLTGRIYERPEVELRVVDPRAALSHPGEEYDVIIYPIVGAFGGTSGLQAMREEYLFTRESFREAWSRLAPDGVLSVSAWIDFPPRNAPKMLATLVEMLRAEGITDIEQHLVAIRGWSTITFALTKSPLNPSVVSRVREFCEEKMFDIGILPGSAPAEREKFNSLQDKTLFQLFDRLLAGEGEAIYGEYAFHLRPATDDCPYFSHFLRWKNLGEIQSVFSPQGLPFLELGTLFVVLTFVQILVVAVLLILLPLVRIGWRGGSPWKTIFYFGGIGIGFMFIEIASIQRLILFWGHPIYSAAAVIAGLLVGAGIGSYLSGRTVAERGAIRRRLKYLLIAAVGYFAVVTLVFPHLLQLAIGLKFLIGLSCVIALGFFMGYPFPLGLRVLGERCRTQTPWAWGINGCTSVISASAVGLLTLVGGFHFVVLLALLAYGLAWFAAPGTAG